ncbi:MAG: patatin-like phospholipase family protein [Proteobacteria bacterium]|nr:patatin-like phospholipase family protein [Pseudomonadota bacterium]
MGTGKLAIALAGGGPLGAFYELGALHALGEAVRGRELTDFDVYVGVSSGALVAAALANGLDTIRLGSTYIRDEETLIPFSPGIPLQPAVGEFARRVASLPGALASIGRQYARNPVRNAWPAAVSSLERILPTAVFDNAPLERYLRAAFSSRRCTDDFRKLRSRLYVVATNLNTGESVNFGDARHNRVPISRAVVASAALPALYPPVEIDGQQYVDGTLIRTMHASLALEAGCDLVICINPLVPFDVSRSRTRRHINLAEEGLPTILGQSLRALIHSRMQVGMASYRARYPQADTLLLEPDRHDATLFFANVFRYSGRHRLVEHAYQKTRSDLLLQADALSALCKRRNLHFDVDILRDRRRTFSTAARERSARGRRATRQLREALRRLEGMLPAARAAG